MRVFVAGATGAVGFEFVRLAKAQGYFLHTFSRSPENACKLAGVADKVEVHDICAIVPGLKGIDVVVSALGAPVTINSGEKRPYWDVDLEGNKNILDAAKNCGCKALPLRLGARRARLSPHCLHSRTRRVCHALRLSGIKYSVIRPTGIFAAFNDLVSLARKGLTTVIGDGQARTNPVHQADVAGKLLEYLDSGPDEMSIGGPEIFTRREIAELAFTVLDKRPRVLRVPAVAFRLGARLVGLQNPRLGELLEFVAAVSITDGVAPVVGRIRLEDHFRKVAKANLETVF